MKSSTYDLESSSLGCNPGYQQVIFCVCVFQLKYFVLIFYDCISFLYVMILISCKISSRGDRENIQEAGEEHIQSNSTTSMGKLVCRVSQSWGKWRCLCWRMSWGLTNNKSELRVELRFEEGTGWDVGVRELITWSIMRIPFVMAKRPHQEMALRTWEVGDDGSDN